MIEKKLIKVLLIDDDEDEYIFIKHLLRKTSKTRYLLNWESSYTVGKKQIQKGKHDIIFLDYFLGEKNGLDLLREVNKSGNKKPIIILTGSGQKDSSLGLNAIRAGAEDYLTKGMLNEYSLERAIRYTIERKQARLHQEQLLKEQEIIKIQTEEQRKLVHILESITDAFFALDKKWCFTFVNKQAESLLMKKRNKLLGKNIWELFPTTRESQFEENFQRALKSGKAVHFEEFYIPIQKWLQVNAYPSKEGISVYFRDYTEKIISQQMLRQSRDQLNIILQNITEGIIVQDHKKYLYVNEAAAVLRGFKSSEEFLQNSKESIFKRFEILSEAGEPIPISQFPGKRALLGELNPEERLCTRNKLTKEEKWIDMKARPVFDEKGVVLFTVEVLQDITEQRLIEQRKNEFISMASHELKTPITSMKLFLEILEKEIIQGEPLKAQKYVKRLQDQTNKLRELVGDMLDVSRIETGKLRFYQEKFRLDELIDDTLEGLQLTTVKHTLRFQGKIPVVINGDRFRLYQVITNLITNALKYSPNANEVVVRIEKNTKSVVVSVQDFGIGIEKKQYDKIFEKLYQVPDAKERTFPGLGMGLYISREIIKRLGGDIWVESNKGKGSTFFFSLPIDKKMI